MDHQVRELTGLLERQAALYHDLASVLTREKEAAVAASTDALEAIRLEKEPLLEVLAAVEKQRIQATQRLAQAVGLESEPVTLSVLASRLGGSAAQGLHQCRQVLVRRIETVGRLNREVGDLLGCCLRLVRGTIAMVVQLTQPGGTYRRSGRYDQHSGAGRILSGNV